MTGFVSKSCTQKAAYGPMLFDRELLSTSFLFSFFKVRELGREHSTLAVKSKLHTKGVWHKT